MSQNLMVIEQLFKVEVRVSCFQVHREELMIVIKSKAE